MTKKVLIVLIILVNLFIVTNGILAADNASKDKINAFGNIYFKEARENINQKLDKNNKIKDVSGNSMGYNKGYRIKIYNLNFRIFFKYANDNTSSSEDDKLKKIIIKDDFSIYPENSFNDKEIFLTNNFNEAKIRNYVLKKIISDKYGKPKFYKIPKRKEMKNKKYKVARWFKKYPKTKEKGIKMITLYLKTQQKNLENKKDRKREYSNIIEIESLSLKFSKVLERESKIKDSYNSL